MLIKETEVKGILTKSNLPEPWGEFVEVKNWTVIRNPEKYPGKKRKGESDHE